MEWTKELAAEELKIRLVAATRKIVAPYLAKEIGLAFSGGLDSMVVLTCLDMVAVRPTIYTAKYSEDSEDLLVSRQIAKERHLKLVEIQLPSPTFENVKKVVEVLESKGTHKWSLKLGPTKNKLAWGIYYFHSTLNEIEKLKLVITGSGSDPLFLSYDGFQSFFENRTWEDSHKWFNAVALPGIEKIASIRNDFRYTCVSPFSDPNVVSFVSNMTKEIVQDGDHKKGILERAFKEEIPDIVLKRKKSFLDKLVSTEYESLYEKVKREVESAI